MNNKVKSTIKTNNKNFVPNKGKILVLAEKPSVGRDIGRVLKCTNNKNSYLEGKDYIVTWAFGHLVTLASPERYNNVWEKWELNNLPMIPSKIKLDIIKQTSKQYSVVSKLMNRGDVTEIIIATDAGREGELVARWIIEKAKPKKTIKRLWISSVTDKAIKDGFSNLKDGRLYENLFSAAVARAEADWIVGLNATRALTCKYNAQLSCGRVQTPTLYMIGKREEEIRKFIPKEYHELSIITDEINFNWRNNKNEGRSFDLNKLENLSEKIKNKSIKIVSTKKINKKSFPPNLYDLTELQRDANKLYDYSAKETLSIMQNLYERHKAVTYPRTDSKYITSDIVPTLKDRLKACRGDDIVEFAIKLCKRPINSNKSFVDNNKVTDHHAIIPTEQRVSLNDLSYSERTIYDLIVKRFIAVLYPPYEYEQLEITGKIEGETFISKTNRTINLGYKEVYGEVLKKISLSSIKSGEVLKILSSKVSYKKTTPPSRFTEGTLLAAMENPKQYMETSEKHLTDTIKETGGLGTVATRADIIEKLFKSFVIEKKGKEIAITSKGKQLLELAPTDLKSPILTAKWEERLNLISKGKEKKSSFVNEMIDYTKKIVLEIKQSEKKYKHDNMTKVECPECGKFMLEVKNKNGKMYVCQDRECGYRKSISRITNSRCPNCHKKLELRGEGDNQTFFCKCGHREKMDSFKKRKESSKKVNKNDIKKYLDEQNKDVKTKSAFSSLSNFKIDK